MVSQLLSLPNLELKPPAIIICTPLTRQYLINYARPLIYTTFMSFPALAAVKATYTFMEQGLTEDLAIDLNTLIETLYSRLKRLRNRSDASEIVEDLVVIPSECPKSPIISLLTPDPRGLAHYCQEAGYIVRAIMAPTVPQGLERVRVCLHSGNTSGQIEGFIGILEHWIEQEEQKRSNAIQMSKARL